MTEIFTRVHTVAIPVTDQDRTKALLEELGFTTARDAELQPGFRWIELAPPGGGATVSLVAAGPHLTTGIDTGIRLVTGDARTAHAALADRGLDVGELLDWPDVPLMFSFLDPDGNRLYVNQDG
jgi:catechol 2,3-dioxygenase-like lactoylglutathione lyase family enzyme